MEKQQNLEMIVSPRYVEWRNRWLREMPGQRIMMIDLTRTLLYDDVGISLAMAEAGQVELAYTNGIICEGISDEPFMITFRQQCFADIDDLIEHAPRHSAEEAGQPVICVIERSGDMSCHVIAPDSRCGLKYLSLCTRLQTYWTARLMRTVRDRTRRLREKKENGHPRRDAR